MQTLKKISTIFSIQSKIPRYFTSTKHSNNLQSLYQHSKTNRTPFFSLHSHHITIIEDPLDFYITIQKQIKKAAYRIGFSSLYLGTGSLQRSLFQNVIKKVEKNNKMEVRMLFDYNRSMRQEKGETSIEMMSYYLSGIQMENVHIAFNKQVNSFNKVLGQIKGVHHQKIAIFDDTLILGGANLSHNYFLNRKDRYLKFKESPQFTDYLYDYLRLMTENCYMLSEPNNVISPKMPNLQKHYKLWKFANQPQQYKQTFSQQINYLKIRQQEKQHQMNRKIQSVPKKKIPISRNLQLAEDLGTQIQPIKEISQQQKIQLRQNTRSRLFGAQDQHKVNNYLIDIEDYVNDSQLMQRGELVYIFPFMHFPKLKQNKEPQVLHEILANSVTNRYPVLLSSGYMNFTPKILEILKQSEIVTKILCSSPLANSFFRAGTFKKYIPYFYRCFEGKILSKYENKFDIKQFYNGQWSFHAKGIWIKQDQNSYLTVVGSSNFNLRSLERDTQLQAYLYSTCPKFNKRLDKQWQVMEQNCESISLKQINQDSQIKYNKVSQFFSRVFSRFL